jgi:holliday junction DNA helicase RuvB
MSNHPKSWSAYYGQSSLIPLIKQEVATGCPRSMLLTGMAGTGKSALAHVVGYESGMQVFEYRCFRDWDEARVAQVFLDLDITGYSDDGIPGPNAARSLIVLDEIHALKGDGSESLLPILDSGHCTLHGEANWLPTYLTVVGATDRPQEMSNPLRSRFALQLHLDPYSDVEIGQIIKSRYPRMSKDLIQDVAGRSRGNPRLALNYADTVAQHGGSTLIFSTLGIDQKGCGKLENAYLDALRRADGHTLSVRQLASIVQEDVEVLRELVEPFLVRLGLIQISPRGRTLVIGAVRGKRGQN